MSTSEHLAQLGVTLAEARDFILQNVQQPSVIYNISVQNQITAQMLAEIYGGVTADDVVAFFNASGLDGDALTDSDTDNTDELESLAQSRSVTDTGFGELPVEGDSPAVESGTYWPSGNLTYSYNDSMPEDYADEGLTGYITFPDPAKVVVRASFDDIEKFTSMTFTEVSDHGDIRLSAVTHDEQTDGYAYFPDEDLGDLGGDIFLSNAYTTSEDYIPGSSSYHTVIHEIGHALGLDHTFEGNGSLPAEQENLTYSVMSYTPNQTYSLAFEQDELGIFPETLFDHYNTSYAYYDVIGLQAVYGANTTYNTGDNTYIANFDTTSHEVIWDAGGTDTIDASSATSNSIIDLRASQFSSIDMRSAEEQAASKIAELNITDDDSIQVIQQSYQELEDAGTLFTGKNNLAISMGVWIENVISGSADDTIQDNAIDNVITTGAGDDYISLTEGGFDTVNGGSGDDQVYFDVNYDDVQTEQQADGSYLVVGDGFAARLTGVETLEFDDTSVSLV